MSRKSKYPNLLRYFYFRFKMLRILCSSVVAILLSSYCYVILLNEDFEDSSEQNSPQFGRRTHYIAAVVEYQPEENQSPGSVPEMLVNRNADNYKKYIKKASLSKADIIVFPEYGLTSLKIPNNRDGAKPYLLTIPEIGINPCLSKTGSKAIQELSCSSTVNDIYVVINVGEIRPCIPEEVEHCPQDGRFQFNTNVAFDRNGTIVAKYEKGNLYFENQFDKPNPIRLSSFITDFGIEFGLFICFDMMFYNPVVKLAEKGIKNFVFPTAWVDELPFLTAIQTQTMWAQSLNVNLLASGYHRPARGQLGSGIYSGHLGAINYTFDPDSGSKMIIENVPMKPSESATNLISRKSENLQDLLFDPVDSKTFHRIQHENDLKNFTSEIINLSPDASVAQVCTDNGFCCELEYRLQDTNFIFEENYRLLAFNGTRTLSTLADHYNWRWQICAVVRCLNETLESCTENNGSLLMENNIPRFESFELHSKFDQYRNNSLFGPGINAIDTKLKLIPFNLFEINTKSESGHNYMRIISKDLNDVQVQTIAIINFVKSSMDGWNMMQE